MAQPDLVTVAVELEKRICSDPIVSDDIKDLSRLVRAIAEDAQATAVAVVAVERMNRGKPAKPTGGSASISIHEGPID